MDYEAVDSLHSVRTYQADLALCMFACFAADAADNVMNNVHNGNVKDTYEMSIMLEYLFFNVHFVVHSLIPEFFS